MHEDQSGLDQVRGTFWLSVEQILNALLFLAFAILDEVIMPLEDWPFLQQSSSGKHS